MIELSIQKKLNAPSGKMLLDVTVEIAKGELVTLYGKSGAGKTSVLRILTGLLSPDSGVIIVNGNTWLDSNKNINLSPQKRRAGFVFQDYALFPNMTVKENLLFALDKNQDHKIIGELIELIELGALQHRKPKTLSGGQKQRVALARALVHKPELLMLDEPLSALDQEMRLKLQEYILQVHRAFGLTTILISHDMAEIQKMSDKILVMDQGKIIKEGSLEEVFLKQTTSNEFQFTGTITAIKKEADLFTIKILVGKEQVSITVQENKIPTLHPGDEILVASRTFNPIIRKIK